MHTLEKFWEILDYLKNDSTSNSLSEATKAMAKSDKAVSQTFFENNLDQKVYFTEDYKRFRLFLIDWYASLRTLNSINKNSNNIFSIPEEYLDEMFKSFGYPYSHKLNLSNGQVNLNKINFFLDLVNLYKIKGSKESITKTLEYHGYENTQVLEYFLKKDTNGNLVFESTSDRNNNKIQYPFSNVTTADPHWMMSESTINTLLVNNKIGLPSKSPYFSLRMDYIVDLISPILAKIRKDISNEYDNWLLTNNLGPQDLYITIIDQPATLLEVYLVYEYVFNYFYSCGSSQPSNHLFYDGTNILSSDIINEFNTMINENITTRSEWIPSINNFFNTFYVDTTSSFIIDSTSVSTILNNINPTLKNLIDNKIAEYIINPDDMLKSILVDFGSWIDNNIGTGFPNIANFVLGSSFILENIIDIVNFFKPYRSRLINLNLIYNFDNRLLERTCLLEDNFSMLVKKQFIDYIHRSENVCIYSEDPMLIYDCGSYYDVMTIKDECNITINYV